MGLCGNRGLAWRAAARPANYHNWGRQFVAHSAPSGHAVREKAWAIRAAVLSGAHCAAASPLLAISAPKAGSGCKPGPHARRLGGEIPEAALLHEPHRALLAHLGLDAVFGLQLLQELVGGEFGRQDVGLPLDGGEITGAQLLQF